MNDNILEMVQGRHEVAVEDYRKLYVAYQMAPLRVTFSDLDGHFCCLKPLCPSTAVVCIHDGALVG